MRSTPSVVRERDPHEDREEQFGDSARQPAERACQPTACGEPPNGAGQGCASFLRRCWPGGFAPKHPGVHGRLLARRVHRIAAALWELDQGWLDAPRPTPAELPPLVPIAG